MSSPSQLSLEGVEIVKRISGRQANKFTADSISKGLFSSHLLFHQESKAEENGCDTRKQSGSSSSPLRRRRQKKFTELSPLSGSQATPVFSSAQKEETAPKTSSKMVNKLQQNDSAVEVSSALFANSIRQPQKEKENENENKAEISKSKSILENLLFFQEQEEQEKIGEQNLIDSPRVNLPEKRMINEFIDSQQENPSKQAEQPQQECINQYSQSEAKDKQESKKTIKLIDNKSEFFIANSLKERKRQLCTYLQPNQTLQLRISRNKDGFNMFWPQYTTKFSRDYDYVIAAKKISAGPASTITISTTALDYTENSPSYLGKLKSNLKGDVINLFSFGLSPSKAKQSSQIPRQLLATIVYGKTELYCPRQFSVYIKKPNYRYYLAFPQVKMYEEQLSLEQLYHHFENRQKIEKYNNRKPTYNESKKGFCLDFHGMAKVSSIKNFILEKEGSLIDYIIMGKNDENSFNLEITGPMSLLIGFAVALTAFEGKSSQN